MENAIGVLPDDIRYKWYADLGFFDEVK